AQNWELELLKIGNWNCSKFGIGIAQNWELELLKIWNWNCSKFGIGIAQNLELELLKIEYFNCSKLNILIVQVTADLTTFKSRASIEPSQYPDWKMAVSYDSSK